VFETAATTTVTPVDVVAELVVGYLRELVATPQVLR
jgi:hypothetical protein